MKIIRKNEKKEEQEYKTYLSYCTACMGRKWQLEKTLPYNIQNLRDDEDICLVNYNSNDGLDEWIKDNFSHYISKGKLKYLYTKNPEFYRYSHAKNLAHRMSNSEWLFSLDADNFISLGTREYLEGRIHKNKKFIIKEYKYPHSGSGGRLLFRRKDFENSSGYDERMDGWGCEDYDLVNRFLNNGYTVYHFRNDKYFIPPIKNTKKQSSENTNMSISTSRKNNSIIANANKKEKIFSVNEK